MSGLPALEADNTHDDSKDGSAASTDSAAASAEGAAPNTAGTKKDGKDVSTSGPVTGDGATATAGTSTAASTAAAAGGTAGITPASIPTGVSTAGTSSAASAATAAAAAAATPTDATDAEIEAMRKRVKEMEDEAKKIEDMQNTVEKSLKPKQAAAASGPDVDARSVYVGNVDYSTTPEELQEFFSSCGIVNRITILCDKFTGHPKGYAYVEFKDADAIANAMLLNDSEFKGRPLKVMQKRTNLPGMADYRPRAAGGRMRRPRGPPPFRAGARGGYAPYAYAPAPRPRFRHRRFFSPYAR